jgi:high-affinity iron transporter
MKFTILLGAFLGVTAMAADKPAGDKLFVANCASCHGPDGTSQTDVGKALKARNLVADAYKQIADKKSGKVTKNDVMGTLKTGVPGTGMASFGHLSDKDREAIAEYVVSLRKPVKK